MIVMMVVGRGYRGGEKKGEGRKKKLMEGRKEEPSKK